RRTSWRSRRRCSHRPRRPPPLRFSGSRSGLPALRPALAKGLLITFYFRTNWLSTDKFVRSRRQASIDPRGDGCESVSVRFWHLGCGQPAESPMKTVEFHFDFGSPNAYLSHKVIPAIEQRTGVRFQYVPVLLGGVFKLTGNQSPAMAFAG